jgi:hypothetical protein
MGYLPPDSLPPVTPMAAWLNRLRSFCLSHIIIDSPDIRREEKPNGTALFLTQSPRGAPGSSGMNFRGEWSSGNSYSVGDVVVLRAGVSAGTYVCVLSAPVGTAQPTDQPVDPTQAIYWVSIARSNTIGAWT